MMMTTNTDDALTMLRDALAGRRGEDQQRIATTGLAWVQTLLAKNADYGGSAWRSPVLCPHLPVGTAILVRMSDKISRLQTLLAGGVQHVVDESVRDTMSDLGAYALLWLARPADDGEATD